MANEPALGARGVEARALLTQRGLTAHTLDIARNLLTALGSVEPAQPAPATDPAADEAAERAMWTWYLEWGEIARVAISDRKLLRDLGFLNYKRPVSDEEVEDVADVAEEPQDAIAAQA